MVILYHLEGRLCNSHVLVYHGPLLSHLLGVVPHLIEKKRVGHPTQKGSINAWTSTPNSVLKRETCAKQSQSYENKTD